MLRAVVCTSCTLIHSARASAGKIVVEIIVKRHCCTIVCEMLIWFEKLLPALITTLSYRGWLLSALPGRRPPVMLLYLLNNACKHSGNAFSGRSIVVISHVGSLPRFAFSSTAVSRDNRERATASRLDSFLI